MKTKTKNSLKEKDPAESPRVTPGAESAMDRTAESLVSAYLASNLHFKNIPLKEFTDDCEKKILLDCLHRTRGSQTNAVVLHGINGRRIRISKKLEALPPQG